MAALFLVQALLGAAVEHYRADLSSFFGLDLAQVLPFNLARTWHVQLSLLWTAASFLAAGIFLTPIIAGREPGGSTGWPTGLLGALVDRGGRLLASEGDLASSAPTGRRGRSSSTSSGSTSTCRGSGSPAGLGLFLWIAIIYRGIRSRLKTEASSNMPWLFFYAGLAIPAFYAVGMLAGTETHLTVAEFWRFWVVHLWVEDFLELFTTVMVAYIFVMLGVVRRQIAIQIIFLDVILYSAGGVIGTMHHLYFSGTPVEHMALGAFFSALEVIPLTFLTVEAWTFLQLGSRQQTRSSAPFPHRWAVMFLVAVGFWNFVGAGVFGFLINLPIVSYYQIGTALTANHAHGAMMGVYGMLAVGLALFALRYIIPPQRWPDKLAKLSFWSLNIGLAWMVFVTLLPLGVLQLWHSVNEGYFEARTLGYITSPATPSSNGCGCPVTRFILGGCCRSCGSPASASATASGRPTYEMPPETLFVEEHAEAQEDRTGGSRLRAAARYASDRLAADDDADWGGDRVTRGSASQTWLARLRLALVGVRTSSTRWPAARRVRGGASPFGCLRLPRGPRRLAVPAGPVAVAAVVRPRQPGDALPRQPVGLQRLPGQEHLHDLAPGREVSARWTWPASEAARFHRGIACAVVLGLVWPLGHALAPAVPRRSCSWLAWCSAAGELPLWSHLRRSPGRSPRCGVAVLDEDVAERTRLPPPPSGAAPLRLRPTRTAADGDWSSWPPSSPSAVALALASLGSSRSTSAAWPSGWGGCAPLGPGLRLVLPGLDKLVRVDLRMVTLTIPPQEVITRDNVPARVNAVVLFRVIDPAKSVMAVENHAVATSQIAQTTLRSVVGRADLDTLLAHRADLNEDLAASIAAQTEPWGVKVEVVEIKDVEIPEAMQRAMAREAEAERERRAKVISAHGELQASAELRDAARPSARALPASSCATCRPCSSSAPTRTPPSCSPSPWTSSGRSSTRPLSTSRAPRAPSTAPPATARKRHHDHPRA